MLGGLIDMKKQLTRTIFPVACAGLLLFSSNGLKEITMSLAKADFVNNHYVAVDDDIDRDTLKAQVKMTSKSDIAPSFTFFIPGMGETKEIWSNNLSYASNTHTHFGIVGGPSTFSYNPASILSQAGLSDATAIYVARPIANTSDFTYLKYDVVDNGNDVHTFALNEENSNYFDRNVKHNLVVFDSVNSVQSWIREYYDFENIVNKLSYDFKLFFGTSPKINLIGHDSGGLVATKYTTDYPYNVSSIHVTGTPFAGSESLKIMENSPMFQRYNEFAKIVNTDGYNDIQDECLQYDLYNDWDLATIQNNEIDANVYGTCMTLYYISALLLNLKYDPAYTDFEADIQKCISFLIQLENILEIHTYTSHLTGIKTLYEFNGLRTALNQEREAAIRARIENFITAMPRFTVRKGKKLVDNDNIIRAISHIPLVGPLVLNRNNSSVLTQYTNYIVNHLETYNGKVGIFLNDGFTELSSQLAYNYYNITETKVKILDIDSLNGDLDIYPNKMGMPDGHHVEASDPDFVNDVMSSVDFSGLNTGAAEGNLYVLHDGETLDDCSGDFVIQPNTETYVINGTYLKEKFNLDSKPVLQTFFQIQDRIKPLRIVLNEAELRGNEHCSVEWTDAIFKYFGTSDFSLTFEYSGENEMWFDNSHRIINGTYGHKATIYAPNVDVYFKANNVPNTSLDVYGAFGMNSTIEPADGVDGYTDSTTRNGTDGTHGHSGYTGNKGASAVYCSNLYLKDAKNLSLIGGNGGNGSRGGHGGWGGNGKTKPMGYVGGNGGNGGWGGWGGKGGDGASGVCCQELFFEGLDFRTNSVSILSGFPGNGGKGGSGGWGGKGANGSWILFTDKRGGNGGNGGLVGKGGDAGTAISLEVSDYDVSIEDYQFMISNWSRKQARGGEVGYCYGNGGNSGYGSHSKVDLSGTPGYAVTDMYDPHGLEINQIYTVINGVTYCTLNGKGYDMQGNIVYYTNFPVFGTDGVPSYFYNE